MRSRASHILHLRSSRAFLWENQSGNYMDLATFRMKREREGKSKDQERMLGQKLLV